MVHGRSESRQDFRLLATSRLSVACQRAETLDEFRYKLLCHFPMPGPLPHAWAAVRISLKSVFPISSGQLNTAGGPEPIIDADSCI